MEIANFFWHGSPLSCYESACINSFLGNGFTVRLWAYQNIDAPSGVEICNARNILPEAYINKYTQAGHSGSLAAFSDFFRFKLLSEHPGWWFDADILCLKSADAFSACQQIVYGYEDESCINGAVLKLGSSLANRLYSEAEKISQENNNNFYWGEVGPKLITKVIHEMSYNKYALSPDFFYPIDYRNALTALDPQKLDLAEHLCTSALTYHIWNEILRQHKIPKNVLPPKNSFLYNKFIKYDVDLKSLPALPADTFYRLLEIEHRVGGIRYHMLELTKLLSDKFKASTRLYKRPTKI